MVLFSAKEVLTSEEHEEHYGGGTSLRTTSTKEVLCFKLNIAEGTTDPGVDRFDQLFWFGRFDSLCLVG